MSANSLALASSASRRVLMAGSRRRALFAREFSQVLVHERGGFFKDAEGADQLRRHDVFADGEVDERAGGLRAVVAVNGDFDLAHGVGLGASRDGSCRICCLRHWRLLERLLPRFYQQVADGEGRVMSSKMEIVGTHPAVFLRVASKGLTGIRKGKELNG